ncbi:hypothetical protein VTK73DRAFT_392 [Phialemonium thermophilum]|uniref:Uncharacterized protein n=1 Tax=Phialemonium thermophilum TaxID=223376 RepID=A0ABR3VVF5_9PEZI
MSPFVGVESGAGWLESRAVAGFATQAGGPSGFVEAATNSSIQQMIFAQLKFAPAKSVRSSTIILATFNAIAAFATALGITYDSYTRARRNKRRLKLSHPGLLFVPAGEVYPLVLSLGIVVQSTTFALAQSTGLNQFFITGCTLLSQIMLPVVFLVPYIQFVFAIEITMRALQKKPFPPRGKWTVSICLTTVGLLVLANFLVADFVQSRDFCFGSLFFFVAKYAMGIFAVLTTITAVLLVCAVALSTVLHRSNKIETTERVTGSRMVYYLALATISNAFLLPFFYCLAFNNQSDTEGQTFTLAMVASVVANVSGVMTGGLYLFLKSNTLSAIGPRNKGGEYDRQKVKHTIRRYGTNDLVFSGHMMRPVSGPGTLRRSESETSLVSYEKEEEAEAESREGRSLSDSPRPNPLRSNAVYPPVSIPRTPEPARISAVTNGHVRKRSYNIFPNNGNSNSSKSSVTLLPATTYSPYSNTRAKDSDSALDSLKPPPSLRNLVGRHRRDSSIGSSATVQIGLRISSVDTVPLIGKRTVAAETEVPTDGDYRKETADTSLRRPSPLGITATLGSDVNVVPDSSPKRDPVKDARMKTLPPVPAVSADFSGGVTYKSQEQDSDQEEVLLLNSDVYVPKSSGKTTKLPSPKGVGFTVPTSKLHNGSPSSSPVVTTPRRQPVGDSPTRSANTKGDWI